jgi:hypothetical protein
VCFKICKYSRPIHKIKSYSKSVCALVTPPPYSKKIANCFGRPAGGGDCCYSAAMIFLMTKQVRPPQGAHTKATGHHKSHRTPRTVRSRSYTHSRFGRLTRRGCGNVKTESNNKTKNTCFRRLAITKGHVNESGALLRGPGSRRRI